MYISVPGSSFLVVSTGKVLESLRPNSRPLRVGQGLQTLEHRDGVDPLQVLVEVMLVEDDVVIAHGVENRARGILIAEDAWGCT